MSYPTEPCFVVKCDGWDESLLKHPVMKFMHKFDTSFAEGRMYSDAEPFGTWHTPDFTYVDEVGKTATGIEGFEKAREMYKTLLADFYHHPLFGMINETEDGYHCFGDADLYGNYKAPGEKKVKDPLGREWHFKCRGAWRFTYRKDTEHPDGFKMSKMVLYANPLPILAGAVKREMVPQDLMFLNVY
ncbi:hypothetical protein ABW20_dc0104411 [Dactylellina cionopaga]|nr:hypothetical protein ABW20_dc0104411 [Dactylellina cionopaga]